MSIFEIFIGTLNDLLLVEFKKKFNDNDTFELHNVAKLVSRNEKETVPINTKNEQILFNDKNNYQHYFRLVDGIVNEYNQRRVYHSFDLKLIAYTFYNRYEIVEFLLKKMPEIVNEGPTFTLGIKNYNFDEKRIFQNERNIPYNLNKFWNLIEINLNVKSSLNLLC